MNAVFDWSLPEDIDKFSHLSGNERAAVIESARYQKTLETFLSVTDDFIYIKDLNHKFLYASDAFAKLTKHSTWKELIGKDDFDIFPEEHAEIYFQYECSVIKNGEKLIQHEEPYYDLEGKLRWVTSTKNPVFNSSGDVIGLIGISKDITEIKEQQKQINYLATHDELTGLFNRRAFFELGEQMVLQARREAANLSLLFIDLDNFKPVNDRLGHATGDQLLVDFSNHLKRCARESDIVVRIGGDEFAILARTKPQEGIYIADRILEISATEGMHGCTCSIGIAESNGLNNLQNLLKAADKAMYKAKTDSELNCYRLAQG